MAEYTFHVAGRPMPQPRTRARAFKLPSGKGTARVYTPTSISEWKLLVYNAALQTRPPRPSVLPMDVSLEFILPRPKGHYGTGRKASEVRPSSPEYPIGNRDDIDNLIKAVLDAITQSGLWRDDSQIVSLDATKQYQSTTHSPGVMVSILEL